MSEYFLLNGKIELYDIEKFKDWLFKELQEQEFVGVFDIGIDKETENVTCSEEKHNIISDIDRMIKIKECTIHEEGMLTQQLINRAKTQGIIEGLKIARKIVFER